MPDLHHARDLHEAEGFGVLKPDDENACLVRAGQGDRSAFTALVDATAPAVWSLARRLTADEQTAEDVLQETFVAAWKGASDFSADARARSWLYGITRRLAARTWRRRAGEPTFPVALHELGPMAGWGEDPESIAARAEDRALLFRGLAQLSDADHELISAIDLEGRERSEVAAELEISVGTLRVRLHRARLRLMAVLKPEVFNG